MAQIIFGLQNFSLTGALQTQAVLKNRRKIYSWQLYSALVNERFSRIDSCNTKKYLMTAKLLVEDLSGLPW